MPKMLKALERLRRGHKDEKGITGLETAIILIAFVVVASVFAYTVLSAGIFSAEKAKEAVFEGLDKVRSTMEPIGSVYATGNTSSQTVTSVMFIVQVTGGKSMDMAAPTCVNGTVTSNTTNVVVVSYMDQNSQVNELCWTTIWKGKNDGDNLLERGEKVEIVIDLAAAGVTLGINTEFTVEVKAAQGATLIMQRVTPGYIDAVMDLH